MKRLLASFNQHFTILEWCYFLILILSLLKFGIPYSSNVSISYPGTWDEYVFFNWPIEISFCASIVFLAVLFFKHWKSFKARWNVIDMCVYALFLGHVVSYIFNQASKAGGVYTLMLFSLGMFFYGMTRIMLKNNPHMSYLIYLALGCCLGIALLYGLYQHVEGFKNTFAFIDENNMKSTLPEDVLRRLRGQRIFSVFVYPNSLAAFLIALLPFLFISFKEMKAKYFYAGWYVGCFIFAMINLVLMSKFMVLLKLMPFFVVPHITIVYGLYLTKSKAGFLIAFIGIGIFIFHILKKHIQASKKVKVAVLALMFTGFICILYIFKPHYFTNFSASMDVRLAYIESCIAMLKDAHWVGFGPGSFGEIFLKYRVLPAEEIQFAHHNFLQVWIEGGLVSFLAMVILFYMALRLLIEREVLNKSFYPVALSLVLMGIHYCVDFDLYVPGLAVLQFVLLGMLTESALKHQEITDHVYVMKKRHKMIMGTSVCVFGAVLLYFTSRVYYGGKYHYLAREYQAIPEFKGAYGAKKYFELSYSYFPKSPRMLWDYARFAMQTRNSELAKRLFETCVKISPSNATLWYEYAMCLIYKGKYEHQWDYPLILQALKNAHEKYPLEQTFGKTYSEWAQYIGKMQ